MTTAISSASGGSLSVAAFSDSTSGRVPDSDKVESLVIRYYFYYPEDFGVGAHPHDLEVAEFTLFLEQTEDGCYRLRLSRVVGFAHGIDWYYNQLNVTRVGETSAIRRPAVAHAVSEARAGEARSEQESPENARLT